MNGWLKTIRAMDDPVGVMRSDPCKQVAMTPRAYMICTTPRSGSTMLINLMRQTGVAGNPEAYFRQLSVPDFCDWGNIPVQDGWAYDDAYIAQSIAWAKDGGDIAGFRANWEAIATLQERLALYHPTATTDINRMTAAFGTTQFFLLERQDKVAQAISRLRAEQSGLWHRNADGSIREQLGDPQQPQYDSTAIDGYIAETQTNLAAWRSWFAQNGIAAQTISYETIAADPIAAVGDILSTLDLDPAAASGIRPGTRKLADQLNTDWAAQYRSEI